MDSGDREPTLRQTVFALAGVGMTNVVAVLLGAALGWWVDRQAGTVPAFLLVGMLAGLAVGVLVTWTDVRQYLRNDRGAR